MLMGRLRAFGACLSLVFAGSASSALPSAADPPPVYTKVCSPITHKCTFVLRSAIGHGDTDKTPPKKGQEKPKTVCQLGEALQACSSRSFGNWSNSQQCYLKREEPQPAISDPRWQGHTDGSIWACVREQGFDQGRHLVTKWVWLPGEPDTVVTDPLTLAYRAIAAMQLQPPQVRTAPGVGQIGLVNMPVWLWVEKSENTWGPINRSASVPGLAVTATAKVTAVDWSMGDGKTVRCESAGTAYQKSSGIKPSPDCGYLYRKTSREQADCKYKVSATARWDITWQSTLGDNGQISMTQQAATQLRIGEAVPVLVDPDSNQAVVPPAAAAC